MMKLKDRAMANFRRSVRSPFKIESKLAKMGVFALFTNCLSSRIKKFVKEFFKTQNMLQLLSLGIIEAKNMKNSHPKFWP